VANLKRAMPNFICPNCGDRSVSTDRTAGFQSRARSCKKCGFGFLFELLDDYYPAPNAAFFILDQEGRLIGTGRGARELTGLGDLDVIGQLAQDVLGLKFPSGDDHISTALEWGVRVLDKEVVVHAVGDRPESAKADIFPAYDDDGGLLLVLTPR
jgi:PAS domain-containing protein